MTSVIIRLLFIYSLCSRNKQQISFMYSSNRLRNSLLSTLFLFIFLSLSANSFAQPKDTSDNHISIQAQLRPRLELRDGAFTPLNKNEKPAALISERTRLTIDYSYKNVLSLRISPQSVGIWGQANMVQGVENSGNKIALFEAWSRIKLSQDWNLKLGRQVISLDDERIFGELDWAQGGRAHDALSVQFNNNKLELKGYLAYNQNYKTLYGNNSSNPSGNLYATNDALPYKLMQTVWLGTPIGKKSKLTALFTNLGMQNAVSATKDTAVYYSQTMGINYFYTGNKVLGNLSAYYQTGKNNAGINTQAYLLAAYAAYNINKRWNMGIGSDLVSGNDMGVATSKNNAFNPYFHTGHKFYGAMDYFYVGNPHKNVGISDSYLKLNYTSEKNTSANLTIHQFFTPNNVINGTKEYEKNLGQEFDISFSHKLNKFTTFVGGYSFYLTTPTIHYLKNKINDHKYQQWFWVSLNINPTIFKNNF